VLSVRQGPESASVQVQATVTSPVCQPLEKLRQDRRGLVDVDDP
jgi:hypothetical protein